MNQKRSLQAGLIVLAPIALGVLAWFVDPVKALWLPACPFHSLTGLNCPGCGSTRAIHQLVHGHLRAAMSFNVITVLLSPLLLWLWVCEICQTLGHQLRRPRVWGRWEWALWVVILVFAVLRNIPIYPFTLLAPH